MIFDVLVDAIAVIEDYQARYPQVYGDLAGEICSCLLVMERLRARLDAIPPRPNDIRNFVSIAKNFQQFFK